LNDIEIRIVWTNGTKVDEMGMGEDRAAELFMDILVASKPFEGFLCDHQMGISPWHNESTMLGFKCIEITI
jgi:hypothetical protein